MKKISIMLKSLVITLISLGMILPLNNIYANDVPDYYYANYKFIDDWNNIWDTFSTISSRQQLGLSIEENVFDDLKGYFKNSFKYLPSNYKTTYEKCQLLADELSKNYSASVLSSLMGNSCYKTLYSNVNSINSSFTVKAVASTNPSNGSAPLSVTFDARNSIDPSSETIPTDNFFWYYRDENGVDTPMGKGNVINYTFDEAGKFIVHLVVRSSNVDEGILDGEKDLTITVAPKAANITVYANTRKLDSTNPLKIGLSEGEKGIVLDGSTTSARDGRKILSHKWSISGPNSSLYSKGNSGTPSYINVPFGENGEYKVTLSVTDNENNTTSETFSIYVSDPVSVIKQSPSEGNTSTTYTFDGKSSYSLTSKINSYLWEIFDSNGDKIYSDQGKNIKKVFNTPGNYIVRLTTTDLNGTTNIDIKNVYVESTTPTSQFTITATQKWDSPSEFTLDASSSMDVDVNNNVDSLEYYWHFSNPDKTTVVSTTDNNEKIVVQFDEIGSHTIDLTVTDLYGKSSTISKTIKVQSVLRPEITAIPNAITRGKTLKFESTLNKPVFTYIWDFGDGTSRDSQSSANVEHVYAERGIYTVSLTVYDNSGDVNKVTEKVFIGEVDYPIAAYRVTDSEGFYIRAEDSCSVAGNVSGTYTSYPAYSVDRYSKFTIDPSISVNTKGNNKGLSYVFEAESIVGNDQATRKSTLTKTFSQTGCHYVDLTVQDSNVGKQDKIRIWFNVKNATPTLDNITLSFPQYTNDSSIGFNNTSTTTKSIFDCSGSVNNITIKVTAINAKDSDGSIAKLKFYYYNADDSERILEYKETWINTPYVYFSIPRISGEYKFGVILYDNDGGVINSEDIIGSGPSVYFPNCNDPEIPTVTLKVNSTSAEVGDTITYSIVSRILSNDEDFEANRTFYYDFTGDGVWDLVTKKDTATYTFTDAYEGGIVPRAAVEYRGKFGQSDGAKITIKNGIKPILFYNSYKNIVIFRDLSIGSFIQRQICFDDEQCSLGNTKYKRTHIVTEGIENIDSSTSTAITDNIGFMQKYPDLGTYKVSLYLKNKYGISVSTGFSVTTSNNIGNGRIASGVNLITIPETTFNNKNPEIFLSSAMNNTLLIYVNHENGDQCYVDTDISIDSDGDGKTDNDKDIACNTLSKKVYEPSYESIIGRIYFTHEGRIVYKNFYVSFEGYVLELTDEQMAIYNDITTLINGIEDISVDNTSLKSYLDVLRKNLNNRKTVTEYVITIRSQLSEDEVKIDSEQKDMLNSILERLDNSDTIASMPLNEYEKNKQEILSILPLELKTKVQGLFTEFESNMGSYSPEETVSALSNIYSVIMQSAESGLIDEDDVSISIKPSFCNICEYYDVASYTSSCSSVPTITDHFDNNNKSDSSDKSSFPVWLKILLIVLISGVVIMGGMILFFAIKARINSGGEDEEEG